MPQEGYPNLVHPGVDFDSEQARKNGAKGGVKSGETRRRQKAIRDTMRTILAMKIDDEVSAEAQTKLGLDGTFQSALALAQIRKAVIGDTDAARFVRDTIGEKPREGIEIGNLADRPFETLDLTQLSDAQLRERAAAKQDNDD